MEENVLKTKNTLIILLYLWRSASPEEKTDLLHDFFLDTPSLVKKYQDKKHSL